MAHSVNVSLFDFKLVTKIVITVFCVSVITLNLHVHINFQVPSGWGAVDSKLNENIVIKSKSIFKSCYGLATTYLWNVQTPCSGSRGLKWVFDKSSVCFFNLDKDRKRWRYDLDTFDKTWVKLAQDRFDPAVRQNRLIMCNFFHILIIMVVFTS